jgi:RimJ/RimL family protein N-acetyltransferase
MNAAGVINALVVDEAVRNVGGEHAVGRDVGDEKFSRTVVEKVMAGGVVYYRAFYHDQQIGITGYSLKTPTLAETVKTTIFTAFRGRGLGGLLSQAIEDECKRLGIKKIISTVYYFNHQMVQIKLKQGYTIEGYHPDHEAPGFHEYSLGKVLK